MYCPEGGNTCSNEWYYVDISFDEDINEEFK
jgi:hypothetical protein